MRLPMSVGEVWVTIIGTGLAILTWASWYWVASLTLPLQRRAGGRFPLQAAPVLAAALILTVLQTVASHDVVDDRRYIYMYFVLGLAWVGVTVRTFPATGLFLRDDVVERQNPAVAPALAGGILGVAAAYAGGNIGDGPGWWVVVACAFWATTALMLAWHVLAAMSRITDAITIDRDLAAGWRLGGFLFACGLILGRSVAGDLVSTDATLHDAALVAWPVVALVVLQALLERAFRASPDAPVPGVAAKGWVPALVVVGIAVAWIASLGMPA
jgi:hypothetical protein